MIYAKPKSYKPAIKKGYSSGAPVSTSSLSGATANPKTGTGVNFQSEPGFIGFAGPGITITQGPKQGGTVIVSGGGYYKGLPGESGQTSSGATVTAKTSASYEAVTAAREKSLTAAASQGQKLTITQQAQIKEIEERQRVNTNIDRAAVDNLNKNFSDAGINNAGDFIKRARAGDIQQDDKGNIYVNTKTKQLYSFGDSENKDFFTAPRSISGSETLTLNAPSKFPGLMNDRASSNTLTMSADNKLNYLNKNKLNGYDVAEGGLYQAFGDTVTAGIKKEVRSQQGTPLELINPFREFVAVSALNFGIGGAKSGEALSRAYIVNPLIKSAGNPFKQAKLISAQFYNDLRPDNLLAGLSYTTGKIAGELTVGDYPGAAQDIGGFYTGAKVFQSVLNPIGSAAKGAITDLRLKSQLSGPEQPFYRNSYSLQGREGTITPQAYSLTKGELQTQLKPKTIYDDKSIFAPETYKPMGFSQYGKEIEAGRLNYNDFVEWADMAGQKTFTSIEKVRYTTPEEVISIFQAEKLRQTEKQGKLTTKTESGETVRLYSTDPLTASIASIKLIYEERNSIFTRQQSNLAGNKKSLTPIEDLNIKETGQKTRAGLFDNVYLTATLPSQSIYGTLALKRDVLAAYKTDTLVIGKIDFKIDAKTALKEAQPKEDYALDLALKSRQKVATRQVFAQAQARQQETATITIQEFKTEDRYITTFKAPFKPISPEYKPKPPEEIKPFKSAFPPQNKGFDTGYDVYSRKQGQLVKINYSSLSKSQALAFGSIYLENTPAASFKILSNKIKVTNTNYSSLFKNIYQGRGGLYIEKRSARINTFGELQGITYKGIIASKASRKVKNIFGA